MAARNNGHEKDPLIREKEQVEARRKRMEERRVRLLNAKERTMGIDAEALDNQVNYKKEQEKLEQQKDAEYAKTQAEWAQHASNLELQRQQLRKQLEMQTLQLNEEHLKTKVLRTTAEEKAFDQKVAEEKAKTPFLVFPGEDLGKDEREKMQRQQQSLWLTEHLVALRRREEEEKEEDRQRFELTKRMNELADEYEWKQTQSKKMEAQYTAQFNLQQAEFKRQIEDLLKQKDAAASEAEIDQTLNSSFMTEDRNTTLRVDNPNRHVPYHFKGFSQEQLIAIQQEQARQIEENKMRKQKQKEEEEAHHKEQDRIRKELIRLEREHQANKAAFVAQMKLQQLKQQEEQRQRQDFMDKQVYINPVQDSYFEQFGTSAR